MRQAPEFRQVLGHDTAQGLDFLLAALLQRLVERHGVGVMAHRRQGRQVKRTSQVDIACLAQPSGLLRWYPIGIAGRLGQCSDCPEGLQLLA